MISQPSIANILNVFLMLEKNEYYKCDQWHDILYFLGQQHSNRTCNSKISLILLLAKPLIQHNVAPWNWDMCKDNSPPIPPWLVIGCTVPTPSVCYAPYIVAWGVWRAVSIVTFGQFMSCVILIGAFMFNFLGNCIFFLALKWETIETLWLASYKSTVFELCLVSFLDKGMLL